MSLAGLGVVAIWHDLLAEAEDNFYEWHNREHMPERVGIPGFLRGRRYRLLRQPDDASASEFFNLYEAESAEVLGGQDYLNRLNQPTPWTRESVAAFLNVSRSICKVLYTDGTGQGGILCAFRLEIDDASSLPVSNALCQKILPGLRAQPRITGAHLARADSAVSSVQTEEKKARSDATKVPSWVLLVEGSSLTAVDAARVSLTHSLLNLGAHIGISAAPYQLEYTRCKTPWSAG